MKITEPTVLLDSKKCRANIRRMAEKARWNGLIFRPHFKTHQSASIGEWFREEGVESITVSSLTMAEYFAKAGWKDITVAFPANVLEIDKINRIAEKIALNLLVVHAETLEILIKDLKHETGILIKMDVGTHRTGVLPTDEDSIESILKKIESAGILTFKGFLAHAGHTYSARSKEAVQSIHDETNALLRQLKNKYQSRYPGLILSTGDTPSCSVAEGWKGIDEIRPGNFVFYDLMQVQIGACELADIAVLLACPVVAKHADRREIIIYGGGVHLSKDRLETAEGGVHFGLPVLLKEGGWFMPEEGCFVKNLSQEHGVVKCNEAFFDKIKLGDVIGILPVHSCMNVDLAGYYLTFENEKLPKLT